jgi:hypothetical protein
MNGKWERKESQKAGNPKDRKRQKAGNPGSESGGET